MSETKHTPGPWEVSDTRVCLDGPLSGWNRTICDLGQYGSDGRTCYPNAKANGLLIAAAPDMLAALEDAREALNKPPFINSQTLKCIDAAIAKAKGGAK